MLQQHNAHLVTWLQGWIDGKLTDMGRRAISDPTYYTNGRRVVDMMHLNNLRHHQKLVRMVGGDAFSYTASSNSGEH